MTATRRFWGTLSAALVLLLVATRPAVAEDFSHLLLRLNTDSFPAKTTAVEAIAASGDPRAAVVLKALLNNALQIRTDDPLVVLVQGSGDQQTLVDAATGKTLGPAQGVELNSVVVNNRMRVMIQDDIARLNLQSADPASRLDAVRQLTGDLSDKQLEQLRVYREKERIQKVRHAMDIAIGLEELKSSDSKIQLQALQVLSGSLEDIVRNRVRDVAEGEDVDPSVRQAAVRALAGIQDWLDFYDLVERVFFGLSLGSVLVLAGIGLAITFGVMGVINMAHGEMMMLGAYTTYVVQQMMPQSIDASLFVAIPAAFLVAGLAGVLIERGVIRFLYGRPLETLLATFGISLFLQQLVRSVFSPLNRSVITPSWMSGSLDINSALSFTYNRLYILLFAFMVFGALLVVFKRTRLGLEVRAVAQNRAMARAMGVRTEWVDALTFGLGSGIAGVAGVALSQLTNVGPNLGQGYIVDSFMVVVFGGVGNLWGTLVSGLSLGVLNKILEPWAGAVLGKIIVLVLLILFIQKRPRGLFPQKGRAAEA